MGRLEAIRDWATGFPGWQGLMKLNALTYGEGEGGVQAEAAETVVNRYINGDVERSVRFALVAVFPWSGGNDSLNAEAADCMEGWADWCREQWPAHVPEIPGCVCTLIEPANTLPQIQQVSETGSVASYRLSVEVRFIEKGASNG